MKFSKAFAPAKINLSLRITGRRLDGYHYLSSIVVFADIGDEIIISPAQNGRNECIISGVFANQMKEVGADNLDENLLGKALEIFCETTKTHIEPLSIYLQKDLPLGGGIGGGSADAAALLRLLKSNFAPDLDEKSFIEMALKIGADVPVCLRSEIQLMEGIGECLSYIDSSCALPAVLINPDIHISTPEIFRQYKEINQNFSPKHNIREECKYIQYFNSAHHQKNDIFYNDLTPAACMISSEIKTLLSYLETCQNIPFFGMSGSGSTCFAICQSQQQSLAFANQIRQSFPYYWIKPCLLS